jgi:hypothetical protein
MKKLFAVLFACSSIASHADVVTFRFNGTVVQATYLAQPGDPVQGTFTYDTALQPYFKGTPMVWSYSDQRPLAGFAARVGQHTIDARGIGVTLVNNAGNQGLKDKTDALSISSGYPLVLDGTTFADGTIGLSLASTPGDSKALNGFHLPNSINVADYPNRYGMLLSDGGPNGALMQFTIDSIEVESVVPGPR